MPSKRADPLSRQLYIGLMSGTSMDGIDAVLVDLGDPHHQILASHSHPWPDELRNQLQRLAHPGENEIELLGMTDALAAEQLALAALQLLEVSGHSAEDIAAIGSHGQTVRHRPDCEPGFSLQIGDPNTLAERTGITVVADFRRRDMACGGQGAPLAPAYHRARFQSSEEDRVVLNLGGIANITHLPTDPHSEVTGYDTGPANTLLDAWARRHLHTPRDDNGAWAASGTPHQGVLSRLLNDPYFDLLPPKSTGPEHFNLAWLESTAGASLQQLPANDVQATLVELSCRSIADAIRQSAPDCARVIACGGGVHNRQLMSRLAQHLPGIPLESAAQQGLDPDLVEATAFAWLAQQTLAGLTGNLPEVTGASHATLLGGIYPAYRN